MPKFFVTSNEIENDKIKIKGKDVNHIKNVLRAKIEDELDICNTDEMKDYKCEIEELTSDCVTCKIISEKQNNSESNVEITIFQGLPKADKMELIIQKSVELGVNKIIPVDMKRCVVRLKDKDQIKKVERWQKISEVASKQCGRGIIPEIGQVIKIKEIVDRIGEYDIILVAYEKEENNYLKFEIGKLKKLEKDKKKIAIVIGPEGGLEEEEVKQLQENGAKVITLGKRILRTETVALNMISILMYELEN